MARRLLAMVGLLAPVVAAGAQPVFTSGPAQVALVELFTSEGCSSCPPAERWLAERRTDADLWRTFVPVAWHVTYWDNLGWPDRFAQRGFTERQYAYARNWRSESVYTPCFVRNGREWRPGAVMAGDRPAGILRVRCMPRHGEVQVEFDPASEPRDAALEAHAVLLGGGIVSDVRAGENGGRTLEHEFVALAAAEGALAVRDGRWRGSIRLAMEAGPGIPRRALAVWVTRRGDLVPLQAAGGWLVP